MVGTGRRIFLVAGEDALHRQRAIKNIGKRILPPKYSPLNTVIFYSKEIDMSIFQEKVFTFSLDREKILIFKDSHRLPSAAKIFLMKNLEKIISLNYIILEIDKDYSALRKDKKFTSDKFFSYFLAKAAVYKISSSLQEFTVEDFKRSVRKHNYPLSLCILEKLFQKEGKGRSLGPQLLGIIVQELSWLRSPLERRKLFPFLWDADRRIKEKGMDSRLAIEILLARLFTS